MHVLQLEKGAQNDKRRRAKAIMDDLLRLMRFDPHVQRGTDIDALVKAQYEAFCKKHAAEGSFITYFKTQWGEKLGKFLH